MDVQTKEKLKLAQRYKKEKKYAESKEIYDEYFNKDSKILTAWDKKNICMGHLLSVSSKSNRQ
ncbi:MAG: hypothetical protein IJF83_02390 [Methanobrevibacter sp.]|nr:hypothetical protein [Methanobrevibacter sp.]